ncbi:MAG: HAMP domain-containing protein [Acidiferrobacterales bacterium]|nr:HAMP domain-containing protein [Acidiferrobacterales bacterium]
MSTSVNIKWYNTIRAKVILTIVITVTLILGLAGVFAYKYIEQREQSGLQELADVSATRLSRHLSLPMWSLDREQVSELLTAELAERRVSAIVVTDEDGKTLFAAKERLADGSIVDSAGTVSGNLINVEREVTKDNQPIGKVGIFVSPTSMLQELKQFGQGVLGTLLVLNIIIILVMVLVLGRLLIEPLRKLSVAADRISRGDMNQTVFINSKDEIGNLADNFGRMQNSLKVAMRRLMQKSANRA